MKNFFLLFIGVFWIAGCSSVSLQKVAYEYYEGDPNQAFAMALRGSKDGKDALLYQMIGGIIGFDLSKPQALGLLESAEELINQNEKKGILSSVFDGLGAVVVNDTLLPYEGYLLEAVMVNYYKALVFMQRGDFEDARVEFNRANDRQRRIKEYYRREIERANQKQEALKNPHNFHHEILKSYSNLEQFASLEGFINPAVSYLSGLFFVLEGDSKGIDLLKEAYAITQNPKIYKDILMALGEGREEKFTWIIIEDGRSAWKVERGFALPFVTPSSVVSVSVALPDMRRGMGFESHYEIMLGHQKERAWEIASFDPLILGEFSKHLPFIVISSVTSSISKAMAQHYAQASMQGGARILAMFGGMAYGLLSTKADLRSNQILPYRFWIARVKNTQGILSLRGERGVYASWEMSKECVDESKLCLDKNNIIYFRNAGRHVFGHIVMKR
ncbi:hypothetical protein [Helicobacter pametensis]|uniref:hypothetical protein n=1 Tax=Helicobacter pametensis TaxID=95149 RepID=UPI0004B2A568|nr:hypothetical protein [Helicobacter pametensis]